MANSAEVLRIARLLESLIAFKKVPIRQLERRLEISNGSLARIFSGKIELKFRHILDILEAIDVPPEVFFKLAYNLKDLGDDTSDDALAHLRQIALPKPAPALGVGTAQVEAVVLEVLRKFKLLPSSASKAPGGRRPKSRKTDPEVEE